jgi:hypothetical protein
MMSLVHESFRTLQAQVDALARGTNPVVFFPPGTRSYPLLPDNARMTVKDGTYYFLPEWVSENDLRVLVEIGRQHELLGFVQSKEEVTKGVPVLVVVIDEADHEVKSAAVDMLRFDLITKQIEIFNVQFPNTKIRVKNILDVIKERTQDASRAAV